MVKGSVHQEYTTIVNTYAPNTGAPKYLKQILIELKREIDSNTIVVGDINTQHLTLNTSSRRKINKEHT